MDYSNNYVQDFDDTISPQLPAVIPHKPSFLGAFLGRTGGTLAEDIQADTDQAKFRMELTKYSMAKIGDLSAMEQHLSSITPEAAERYQALVDACTRQTIKQIERW